MNVKRLTRLLKMLQMLESEPGQNSTGLAKNCGVGRRTIFRDIEALREAGVPLEYDAEARRFSISSAYFLPPTNFTAEEALALVALAAEMGGGNRLPFYQAASTAALKLEGNLPAPLRRQLRRVKPAITIRPNQCGDLDGKATVYQQLLEAINARRIVHIQYDSLTEWELIATKLRPYQLLFNQHSWYVIGRSSLHREIRIFNLSRIKSIEKTRAKFVVPRSFDLKRYLGNAWQVMRGIGRDSHVVVQFKPLVARNVAEVIWHKTQRTKFLPDGSLEFRVTVSGLNEIAWWILGYGDQAEVKKPVQLRRLIGRRASNMAAIYNRET